MLKLPYFLCALLFFSGIWSPFIVAHYLPDGWMDGWYGFPMGIMLVMMGSGQIVLSIVVGGAAHSREHQGNA